jgi:hypothetical protein
MKLLLSLGLLSLVTISYAQQVPGIAIPSFQPKFNQYGVNQLTSINTSLESKRNKNFVIDFKSLLAGNDLKNAEEHDLNVKYGIKSLFGGTISTNFYNSKNATNQKDNEFYGLSYSLLRPNSSLNFSFKSSDTLQTQYKGVATQIYQLDFKAKF